MLSKTLAEEAAWKFTKENGIDMVTINPGWVIGPLLQPSLNLSAELVLNLIKGKFDKVSKKMKERTSEYLQADCILQIKLYYRILLIQGFEICLLQELKHFPIDHTGGLMLGMLPMHTFKHMRSQKLMEGTAW